MSQLHNTNAHKRILKDNGRIRKIQRALQGDFIGRRVKILSDKRGATTCRRYKAGTEFVVYDLLVEGHDVTVWLSRVDESPPSFELSVWLYEVEFLPKVQA